jgi:hypothetical protein
LIGSTYKGLLLEVSLLLCGWNKSDNSNCVE